MQAAIKLAATKSSYPLCNYVLFNGNAATGTDLEAWAVETGDFNFEQPTLVHVNTVKAALKINKALTWADGKLTGIKPAALPKDTTAADFPRWIKPTGTAAKIEALNLDQIKGVFAAAGKRDVRYYLNGVCFNLADRAIIATDGHRLHLAQDAFAQTEGSGERIIHRDALALGIAAKMDGIAFYDKHAIISHASGFIITKLIDGKFPDYKRVVPDYKDLTAIEGDASTQLAALKNAQAALGKAKFHAIGIDVATGQLNAYRDGETIYSAPFFAPSKRDFKVAYMAGYVADVLANTERATFKIFDSNSSMLINCDKFVAVVMPCRI